jgi:hypothetical protein
MPFYVTTADEVIKRSVRLIILSRVYMQAI